jgi:aryl-alcohol dehydrogenase-like predicted oxidoreductase
VALPTRELGNTGTAVTVLGYGAMELRGAPTGPQVDDEEAGALLNSVLDSGINFIDTSIDYGRSEELIGRYIGHRRDEYFLASKCGCPMGAFPPETPRPLPHDFSPANVRAGVEQSLRRLGTDRLDLVQVHISPSRAELKTTGTIGCLEQLRAEGKIRFIGMSGTLPNLPDHIDMGVFDAFQIPYSALQREHESLISRAAAAGAGTVIRGGVARGAPSAEKDWQGPLGLGAGVGRERWADAGLESLLDGMDRMAFVLRFTLSHPDLHTTIVGTSNAAHFQANLAAAEQGPLPADLYEQAKLKLSAAGSAPV